MKQLKEDFVKEEERDQNASSLLCLARAVINKGYGESVISKGFNTLVDKEDWKGSSKMEILAWLNKATEKQQKV